MTMKSHVFAIALLLSGIFALSAVNEASATDIRSHWKPGEERTWQFKMGLRQLGFHTARFVGMENVPGLGATCLFEMTVDLDMTPAGHSFRTERSCSLYYAIQGLPARYIARYKNDGRAAWIDGVVQGNVFRGFSSGIARDSTFSLRIPPETYLCDNSFAAQWQMVFAGLDLTVGDTVPLDILIPEDMRRLPVKAVVTGYEPITIDTQTVMCMVVSIGRIGQRFYVGPDKKLMRVIEPRQGLVIDLIASDRAAVETKAREDGFRQTLPRRLFIWSVFGLWSIALMLALGKSGFWRTDFWVLFAITGAAFALVLLVEAPVAREIVKVLFTVIGTGGIGLYIGTLIAAFISGIFKTTLKIAAVWLNRQVSERKPNLKLMTALGAAAGTGFGFVEACWLTGGVFASGQVGIVSLLVWERLITMVFHSATGALLGYGVGRKLIWQYWLVVVVLHAFANFLVIFLRQGFIDVIILESLLTLFYFAVLLFALALKRRVSSRQ